MDHIERARAAAITTTTLQTDLEGRHDMAYRTDQPLIKPKPQPSHTDERQELLTKAASASDPTLIKGYLARARELPESGPKLPADATASVAAMIDVLAARGATQRTAAN
jgi:hypothetical protein